MRTEDTKPTRGVSLTYLGGRIVLTIPAAQPHEVPQIDDEPESGRRCKPASFVPADRAADHRAHHARTDRGQPEAPQARDRRPGDQLAERTAGESALRRIDLVRDAVESLTRRDVRADRPINASSSLRADPEGWIDRLFSSSALSPVIRNEALGSGHVPVSCVLRRPRTSLPS
jgi:hypothetical protein